ncbi:bifunctional diguanylate cyclase/phosphodiesterase [Psychromonas sp. RZ22]|uniref:putative bifunctional diguanylate cyclase/phosphodiesterase n=1 Tax=Psychromonas algarum TaxID=2555643 RepID=UPI0010674F61|nr:bifunctional diguanylate cyclase/phosphodiesterase [Psychromonas sp. RZ22]TEW54697.1 bifunctional diguanylate cyclase/phosphodiesterase [Psychromonas sp. RZ22]
MHYKKNPLSFDIFIVIVIAFASFALFIYFDVVDRWFYFTRAYEKYDLDEIIGLFFGFFIGLLFFSYRLFTRVQKDNQRISKLVKSLQHEVLHDHLTSLPNRRSFEQEVLQLINKQTDSDNSFTLFNIDIDSFKYINDTLGDRVGDQLLVAVAKRLLDLDIEGATLARIGGDEFCMVVVNIDEDACLKVCEQLNGAVVEPFSIADHKLYISYTVGISRFPEDGTSYERLLQTAHIAMCMGKKSGNRRNNFKDSNFTQMTKMCFIIQNNLKDALKDNQLYVEYQPKVNLSNSHIIGCEALIRWRHPEHGFILPDEFIYIAEEAQKVHLIDFFVLEEVCKQLKAWGELAKPVSVNLSPILFVDEDLADKIIAILNQYQIPPHLIELEITERTLFADSDVPLLICQKLVKAGITLSLDDFGTGYSSLAHIADFPISAIKIDRAFITQICHSERTLNIVTAIISLAKAINIKVIAEGIETEEESLILKELACDEAQGYFFDRPLSKDVFSERLLQLKCK